MTTKFYHPYFSKLWVTYFGKSNYSLVSPLVDSLLCDFSNITVSSEIKHLIKKDTIFKVLSDLSTQDSRGWKSKLKRYEVRGKTVRSIQRLPTRFDLNSQDIADAYTYWLPCFFKSLIKVRQLDKDKVGFCIGIFCLLELTLIKARSDRDRQLFYITGGLLVKRKDYGWLEFRQVDQKRYTLSVIHEFEPMLPWFVYVKTQAPLHKYVMHQFASYIEKAKGENMGSYKESLVETKPLPFS